MSNITVNETLLTGSEGLTSLIDDRTLTCSPAPVAASTVIRERGKFCPRVPLDIGGSFLYNKSVIPEDKVDDGSHDRSSLGLLPSNYLLEMENDLLRQDSIFLPRNTLSVDSSAVTQSTSTSNNSHKNQLHDSASTREDTSDSCNFMVTVKKCPQDGTSVKDGGRYVRQALFQNVEEVNESRLEDSIIIHTDCRETHAEKSDVKKPQQNDDSGMGQAMPSDSQGSKCSEAVTSGVVSQFSGGDVDTDGKLFLAQNEQEEIDHTIHQVELEAEDLEELEEIFSDFDGSSDEEICNKLARDGETNKKPELSMYADGKDKGSKYSAHAVFNDFPSMDGLFKVPLPPSKPLSAQNKMYFGNTSVLTSSEASLTFGDSIQFYQSGSGTDWGPSIDFDSSTHVGETACPERESFTTGSQEMNNNALTNNIELLNENGYNKEPKKTTGIVSTSFKDFGELDNWLSKPEQPQNNHAGELLADGDGKVCDVFTRDMNPFGDFPDNILSDLRSGLHADHNPFTDFADELTGEEFGDENFMVDTEAAAAMLAEDEQRFKKDNIDCSEFNLTLGSVRGEDQTFMNMTIGTYMAMGSGDIGSLTLHDKRPEFGMSVKSPPSVRPCMPILSPSEIFSPPQRSRDEQSCSGKPESLNNSLTSLAGTNLEVTSQKESPQHNSLKYNSEDSCMHNHSPAYTASSKTFVQSDPVQNSFLGEMYQTISQINSFIHCPVASAKTATDKYLLTTGAGSQLTVMSQDSRKAENDSTLGQTRLLLAGLEDASMNSTSEDITFSSIYKLIERSDISLSDPGALILSEYNRKMKEKQEEKQSKEKTNTALPEKGPSNDVKSAKVTLQIQASSKSDRKEIPQGKEVKESTMKKSTDLSKPIAYTPEMQAEKHPAVDTGLHASTDLPKHDIQADKSSYKSLSPCSISEKDNNQTGVNLQLETKTNLSLTEIHHSQNKISDEVPSKDLKPVSQNNGGYLSAKKTSQIAMNAKSARPHESTNSHKNIPAEMSDNQQRNVIKGASADCRTTSLLQSQQIICPSLAEDLTRDSSLSLESVTINSQYSLLANTTNMTVSHLETSISRPSLLKEKISQLCVTKSLKNAVSPPENLHQLLNMTVDDSVQHDVSDMLQFQSLVHDNTNSILQSTGIQDKFVSSTPLSAHRPGIQRFANSTQMVEKSILPLITPKAALNILEVPEVVYVPDVCCVLLSQQTSFTIMNLLDRGVKCLLTIREVTFRGQRIDNNLCPFELKRQVILSPSSSQSVQVIFRPKDQGEFIVDVEIFSQNMTRPQENRTYILHLSACAEFPSLKISPVNDEIDFGELLWGNTSCRSVRIQNVGRATIPLRFSIFRKESALCNFSFYPEGPADVSSISQTTKPAAVSSVYSMSLPGRKDGQKITTETVNIYCQAKKPQNLSQRYLEKAQMFQAVLSLAVDMPVEDIRPLNEMKLQVTVGMYKLHVDRETLSISAAPGKSDQGTIKIINSGNIPMHVDITLEPQKDHFSLSTGHVVIPSGGNCPVHVSFTPQPIREDQDNKVNVMLQNQVTQHYISVIGKVKTTQTKISGSTVAVNFGGVGLGQSQKQKFTFIADNDDDVKVWIKNPGSAFKLLNEDGAFVESLELSVVKNKMCPVWIAFFPSEVMGYCADLVVQILYANRYTIPISGYGGCSKLLIGKISEAQTGERWLDIGCLSLGTSIVRKITVRNTGVRSCFIKASFYDVLRQEFQPFHATVMPSSLILAANEATDLLLMVNPSQKEVDLCHFGRALVAFIKLTCGDEIMRQHFVSSPGKQSRQLVSDFDIPLTATQREIVDTELKSVRPAMESYSLLKKAMSVIKIGLFGSPPDNQNTTSVPIISRIGTDAARSLSQNRPALTPVNLNVKPIDLSKDDWTVSPSEIQFRVGDSQVNNFVQIINFSTKELQFSVEVDEGITVVPSKAAVKPKNTTMLAVHGDLSYFSRKEPAAQCGLIKVHCLQQTKYVRVYLPVTSGRILSPNPSLLPTSGGIPTTTSTIPISQSISDHVQGTISSPLSRTFSDHANHTSSQPPDGREAGRVRIQGSNMIIFPTTEATTKTDQTYFFTNTSTDSLTWELAPFAPPYVKHADNTQALYRVNYDAFKLSPLTGVLQPDETEKVSIEFSPQSKGYYNQAWCIYDTADGKESSHRFSIYAKASPNPTLGRRSSEEDIISHGLSPTHVSTSPKGSQTHRRSTSQGTESLTYSRESAASHFTDMMPAIKTTQSSASSQYTSSTLNPGAFWSPVPQSDDELSHSLTVRNKVDLSSPVNSRHSSEETNASLKAVREKDISSVASTSIQSSCSQQPNAAGDGSSSLRSEKGKAPKLKCLHLVHDVIEYPKLHPGESTVLKIYLKNPSNEDTKIVVEHEPKPPFLIKHYNFSVGKEKMVMFPVTFKPRHVAKFRDKVMFRETHSGNSFTAVLEAECVNKLAVV